MSSMKVQPIRFHIVTIFPDMFVSYFAESILSRAIENKLLEVKTYALREYTTDKHRRVDGKPYGGGPGMVM
jgi:tRNA (guanine37-N1)-methyltransferase